MIGTLDWILIIGYMLAMVGVGLYFRTNDSMSDFAVADKKLGAFRYDGNFVGHRSWRRSADRQRR